MVSTLGAIGWLNAAPSPEVGSDLPNFSARIPQVAWPNHEIAVGTNWLNPTRSREVPHPAVRVAKSDPDVSATGNPTIAPLKWAGLVLNYAAFEKDGQKYNWQCTGQFISPTVILTAAHCIQDSTTGAWYDLKKMYFLAQYQNKSFSQSYRAVCASRFDGWYSGASRSGAWRDDFHRPGGGSTRRLNSCGRIRQVRSDFRGRGSIQPANST
jgi:trypsin